jgi:hypothetical protein
MERTNKPGSLTKKIDPIDDEALDFLNEVGLTPISKWDGKGKVVNVTPKPQQRKMERTIPPKKEAQPIENFSEVPEEYILAAIDLNKELGLSPAINIKHTSVEKIKKDLIKAAAFVDLDDDTLSVFTLQTLKGLGCRLKAPVVPIPSSAKNTLKLQQATKLLKIQKENQANIKEFPHLFVKNVWIRWSGTVEAFERNAIVDKAVYSLAGDANKRQRQEVVSALYGESMPASKCGIVVLKMKLLQWLDK